MGLEIRSDFTMHTTLRDAISFTAAIFLCAPTLASANVYKCAGEGGTPIYQEDPCAPGKELRNFQTDPPPLTILPAQRLSTTPPPKEAPVAKDKDAKPGKATATPAEASERKFVHPGMSEAEVLAKLGQPDVTAGGKSQNPVRWTYMPTAGDPDTITTLILTSGKVTDVERKVVKK
jgi:hypothetical protein